MEPAPSPAGRRLTDVASPATVIGPGTTVNGDVSASEPLEIRGTVQGSCRVTALCIVAEGGRLKGDVDATGLVVAGEVEAGKLTVDRVELRSTARVRGSISARVLAIADGAFYEGDVQMEGAGAEGPTFFKDRRQGTDDGSSRG